jgi:phage/plasmid primase-like uncharacterized protein
MLWNLEQHTGLQLIHDGVPAAGMVDLARWTGHPSQGDRHPGIPGTPAHAREQLRVHIAAMMMGDELHVGYSPDPKDIRGMTSPWRELIMSSPVEVFQASMVAERVVADLTELGQERRDVELDLQRMQQLAQEARVEADIEQMSKRPIQEIHLGPNDEKEKQSFAEGHELELRAELEDIVSGVGGDGGFYERRVQQVSDAIDNWIERQAPEDQELAKTLANEQEDYVADRDGHWTYDPEKNDMHYTEGAAKVVATPEMLADKALQKRAEHYREEKTALKRAHDSQNEALYSGYSEEMPSDLRADQEYDWERFEKDYPDSRQLDAVLDARYPGNGYGWEHNQWKAEMQAEDEREKAAEDRWEEKYRASHGSSPRELVQSLHDILDYAEQNAITEDEIYLYDRAGRAERWVMESPGALGMLELQGITVSEGDNPTLRGPDGFSVKARHVATALRTMDAADKPRELAGASIIQLEKDHPAMSVSATGRTYLAVTYDDRVNAKEAGAMWDKEAKAWYVPEGGDKSKFTAWIPDKSMVLYAQSLDPVVAFSDALRERGFELKGLPVANGKIIQRVSVVGDKPGEKSGAYTFHLDGIPAGYIENYKDGLGKQNWKAKGVQQLSPVARASLLAAAAQDRQDGAREKDQQHERVAAEVRVVWENGMPAKVHAYLEAKGIAGEELRVAGENQKMPYTDRETGQVKEIDISNRLMIPVHNATEEIQSLQIIDAKGGKVFWPGGKMEAGSHRIGDAEDKAWPVIVAEGYATGETLHRMTGHTVEVAFNAGNLKAVAERLREENPHRTIYIAGDNDWEKEGKINEKTGRVAVNVGKIKAMEAAEAVGGHALIPRFEQGMKGSDWNDLVLTELDTAKGQLALGISVGRAKALAINLANEQERSKEKAKDKKFNFLRREREISIER